jgi:hypothetical protein
MANDTPERPLGQRFSHVYLRRADLLQDSPKARRRIAALLSAMDNDHLLDGISGLVTREIGVDLVFGYDCINWPKSVRALDRAELLDLITIVFGRLTVGRYADPHNAGRFVREVNRIFDEESLHYEVDAKGGVHFKVDQQFAATTAAAIAGLGAPRYANAKAEFERGMEALSKADIDGKQGIRGVFDAVECVYKLMFSKAPKLDAADAVRSLLPEVQRIYASNPTAARAATKSINALADWVNACHNYRHAEGVEEPTQPPMELAVQLMSVGASLLRWLISIDSAMQG